MRKVVYALAALPILLFGNAVPANALPDENLLDLYFLKLLGERGMTSMGNDDKFTTTTGKLVCTLLGKGYGAEELDKFVQNAMQYGPSNIRTPIFTALALRTYCPPSLKDASWAYEPWAQR